MKSKKMAELAKKAKNTIEDEYMLKEYAQGISIGLEQLPDGTYGSNIILKMHSNDKVQAKLDFGDFIEVVEDKLICEVPVQYVQIDCLKTPNN
jgi:hypothetical protein